MVSVKQDSDKKDEHGCRVIVFTAESEAALTYEKSAGVFRCQSCGSIIPFKEYVTAVADVTNPPISGPRQSKLG